MRLALISWVHRLQSRPTGGSPVTDFLAWTQSTTKGFPKGQFNNCSPREFLVSIACKEKKTRAEKAYIRAESANANGFENLPLYAAAIVRCALGLSWHSFRRC